MTRDATPPTPFFRWHHAIGTAVLAAVVVTSCKVESGFASAGGGGSGGGDASVSSTGGASVGRSLRRLSHREYNNVVRDLLGDTTQPASALGLDVYTNGFDNGSDGLLVQGSDVLGYETVAETLAATAVASNLPLLIGSCNPQTSAATCEAAFLTDFVKRAYRRPPTATELQRLTAVYMAGAANDGFTAGIQLALEAVLQSPSFLYRLSLRTSSA
jgi:hypothetical protein